MHEKKLGKLFPIPKYAKASHTLHLNHFLNTSYFLLARFLLHDISEGIAPFDERKFIDSKKLNRLCVTTNFH